MHREVELEQRHEQIHTSGTCQVVMLGKCLQGTRSQGKAHSVEVSIRTGEGVGLRNIWRTIPKTWHLTLGSG